MLLSFSHSSVYVCHKVVCNSATTFSFRQFWALGRETYKSTNVQFPFTLVSVRNYAAGTQFVGITVSMAGQTREGTEYSDNI